MAVSGNEDNKTPNYMDETQLTQLNAYLDEEVAKLPQSDEEPKKDPSVPF